MPELPASLLARLRAGGSGLTVLAIRLGAMGDVVRTLPAVRLVKGALPGARIHWAVDERWGTLLSGHPDLAGILPLPRARWDRLARSVRGWPALVGELVRFRRAVREPGAGLVLDFHGNLRSGLVGLWSRAPVRLGFDGHQQKEGNRRLTTHRVPSGERRVSRMERNLSLVRVLGIPDGPLPDAGLPETGADVRAALETSGGVPYAVIWPGASRRQAYKRVPAPLLAEAARACRAEGILPLVLHGPGEEEDAAAVLAAAAGTARPGPVLDLRALAALLRRAVLYVGGDTGPLHLACGVGCPVVGVYGPTDPVVNAPWGVPHVVVSPPGRVYHGIPRLDRAGAGFDGIVPDDVTRAVVGLARERRARP